MLKCLHAWCNAELPRALPPSSPPPAPRFPPFPTRHAALGTGVRCVVFRTNHPPPALAFCTTVLDFDTVTIKTGELFCQCSMNYSAGGGGKRAENRHTPPGIISQPSVSQVLFFSFFFGRGVSNPSEIYATRFCHPPPPHTHPPRRTKRGERPGYNSLEWETVDGGGGGDGVCDWLRLVCFPCMFCVLSWRCGRCCGGGVFPNFAARVK